jgi:EAL domain-containing protein (putative c-di-GMP-specific phosphodiesterase class I)/GGDEF domain-containing protein
MSDRSPSQIGPVTVPGDSAFDALRDNGFAAHAGMFVAVLEVVRFAQLRRSVGYTLSNALMQAMSERLQASVPGCQIGRIGRTSIEFAFSGRDRREVELLLCTAADCVQRTIEVGDLQFDLSVAIGVVDATDQGICDELVDLASSAAADAHARRVRWLFAEASEADSGVAQDIDLIRDLGSAIEHAELELHYQPKLHARLDRITSAEALLRWNHPRFGRVSPDRFIKLAEETGSIGRLTDWVLATAVRDQAVLTAAGYPIEVHVNLSGQLLQDDDFAARALEMVEGATAPIGFEITETAVIEDPEAAMGNLRAFRDAGIKIAIDDYGSGLSSLAYLKQLPAQELKIDRMFVSGLVESHRDPLLVRSSIDLAHALEMEVTAEGVDNGMTLSLLRVMGCDLLQGFLISKPLALPELLVFLADDVHLGTLTGQCAQVAPWTTTAR